MDLESAVGISGTDTASPDGRAAPVRNLADRSPRPPPPRTRRGDRCPADRRIEAFLNDHFADLAGAPRCGCPTHVVLPRHGIARELSLPRRGQLPQRYLTSYRVRNGVLHNPRSDRRTTEGTFHVSEGGLPIPGDKKAVPRPVFAALFRPRPDAAGRAARRAVHGRPRPSRGGRSSRCCCGRSSAPRCPASAPQKTHGGPLLRPGGLVSNLDFVESIFGNAGDPYLPENDAGLDVEHWTGHTGCVILAPHLTRLTKKELGLPDWDDATERQRRDGMCWRDPAELYNDGQAFKVTCRDAAGVIVTLIADNYYGYCKKEVKTQISYAANLFGNVEEEHSGGALAFARYNLGYDFDAADYRTQRPDAGRPGPRGHRHRSTSSPRGTPSIGISRTWSTSRTTPGPACPGCRSGGRRTGREAAIPLRPGKTYMTPSGYKVQLEKHPATGTLAADRHRRRGAVLPQALHGLRRRQERDLQEPAATTSSTARSSWPTWTRTSTWSSRSSTTITPTAGSRARGPDYSLRTSRPLLSPLRSLGSVIKLLTPSDDYTDGVQRLAGVVPRSHLPAGLPHQAVRPAQDAGQLARASSASTRSTAGPATS